VRQFHQPLCAVLAGSLTVLSTAQTANADITRISEIQIEPTQTGLELILSTRDASQQPQIFATARQNEWIADITNVQLDLENNAFRQENPAPGIQAVNVTQIDANTVRIVAVGDQAISGDIVQRAPEKITFAINPEPSNESNPPLRPDPDKNHSDQTARPDPSSRSETRSAEPVLVPDPDVTITGGSPPTVPPTLPRAIAPPVGDITVSSTDASPTVVNLGTDEVIPKLVLREAPVREVLSLLARAADLNLAFSDPDNPDQPQGSQTQGEIEQLDSMPTISLDVENESIQTVFNTVLELTNLEANRRGRTIFVGMQLPNSSRNLLIRSLRLNQVQVGVALNSLVAMGAESAVSRERLVTSVNAVPIRSLNEETDEAILQPAVTQSQTTTEQRLETQRVDYADSTPPLRGLLVFGDERTNMLTLAGTPQQIEIAAAQLTQLDIRRRQVSVNVRVIDVNLSATETFGGSFSFGINDVFVENNAGAMSVNINDFGDGGSEGNSRNAFAAELNAQIVNGNAKILTDPTLLVQEGQTATVALTQEVSTTTGTTTFSDTGEAISFEQDDPRAAGLTLAISIDRIDDNGFVALSVAPTITAPAGEQENPDGSITTLLSARSLQSGQVRLRDGQTLILSGIIQDSDRSSVTKVPILGDIPILGALFRSEERGNSRQEVIVLLTPQVLDDSGDASFGYRYTSDQTVQEMMR
jgi:type IV pilus assembly protein PilQ